MHTSSTQRSFQRRPTGVAIFCVLLAALFLYNPFVALVSPVHGVAYHSLSRNRATVGASELQQFTPQQILYVQPELFLLGLSATVLRPLQHSWRPAHLFATRITPRTEIPSNLCFRPPPVV